LSTSTATPSFDLADRRRRLNVSVQGGAPIGAALSGSRRVRIDGKFFKAGDQKFWAKGVTYGPFRPREDGVALPDQLQIEADMRQIIGLGANVVRVYHTPPREFLDTAHEFRLKVFVDVPWSKHRCFLDSREDMESGRRAVREAARACRNHPALFALSVVNEIPADVVRWTGHTKVERFIDELIDVGHQEDPEALLTFASFPPIEYVRPRGVAHGAPAALHVLAAVQEAAVLRPRHVDEDLQAKRLGGVQEFARRRVIDAHDVGAQADDLADVRFDLMLIGERHAVLARPERTISHAFDPELLPAAGLEELSVDAHALRSGGQCPFWGTVPHRNVHASEWVRKTK